MMKTGRDLRLLLVLVGLYAFVVVRWLATMTPPETEDDERQWERYYYTSRLQHGASFGSHQGNMAARLAAADDILAVLDQTLVELQALSEDVRFTDDPALAIFKPAIDRVANELQHRRRMRWRGAWVAWGNSTFAEVLSSLERLRTSISDLKEARETLDGPLYCKKGIRQKNPFNVAVCAYGSFRVNEFTVPNFTHFVYNHLGEPDVFLYVKPLNDAYMSRWQAEFKKMVKRDVVVEDLNYSSIREQGGYSPCLDKKEKRQNNWNTGWPTSRFPFGSGIHQLRGAEQCGRIIKEEETRRGQLYDWVVLTRTDHNYLAPHPHPLFLPHNAVSIPSGEDYHGVNDRHAIFPRHIVEARFRIHEELMTGKYDCSFRQQHARLNGEGFMMLFYRNHNISISRYPTVGFLACCEQRHMFRKVQEQIVMLDPGHCYRYGGEMRHTLIHKRTLGWMFVMQELIAMVENAKRSCIRQEEVATSTIMTNDTQQS